VGAVQPSEMIDRTLAIVEGQVITLSDARTAIAFRLVELAGDGDSLDAAMPLLVDRLLVLREVQRYVPPEPAGAIVEERLASIRARFTTSDLFKLTLDAGGFTEARLRAWIRDDLRIAAYLDQRFAAAGIPSDDEVSAYYARKRETFDRERRTLEDAAPIIRAELAAERRAELIADWIADLRRRSSIVELWKVKDH